MPGKTRRRELAYQKILINSYDNCGGHARKWASEWQKGLADLVCALPLFGTHLLEVKHVPEMPGSRKVTNPMSPMQRKKARDFIKGGGEVYLALVVGDPAPTARLYMLDTQEDGFDLRQHESIRYELGEGFNMKKAMELWTD